MLLSTLGFITLITPTAILWYLAFSKNTEIIEGLTLVAFTLVMLCILISLIAIPTLEGLSFVERSGIESWQSLQIFTKNELESKNEMTLQERLQYVEGVISRDKEFHDVHVSYYVAIAESLVLAFFFIVFIVNPPDPWSAFVFIGAYFPLVIGIGLKITWQYARKMQSSIWRIAVHSVARHSLQLILINFLVLAPLAMIFLIETEAALILFALIWLGASIYLLNYQERIRLHFRFSLGNMDNPAFTKEDNKKRTSLFHMIAPEWYVKSYSKFLWEVSLYIIFFVGMSILNLGGEFIQILFYWIIIFLIASLGNCTIDILKQKLVDRMAYLIFKYHEEKNEWPNDIYSNQLFELYDFNRLTKPRILAARFVVGASGEKETSSNEEDSIK